jgi:chromosomal replication initiation ATPase DnaA
MIAASTKEVGMVDYRKREEDRARAQIVTALVATALNMHAAHVNSDSRRRPESAARAIVYYIMRCAFGLSLGRVAAAVGRDRSTIRIACDRMEERREDPNFDRWLASLERAAVSSPLPICKAESAA